MGDNELATVKDNVVRQLTQEILHQGKQCVSFIVLIALKLIARRASFSTLHSSGLGCPTDT
jgi:hypothetical protein